MSAAIDLKSDISPLATAVLDALAVDNTAPISQNPFDGMLAAVDESRQDDWIGIYRVGTSGATLVEYRTYPTEGRRARRDSLTKLGLRICRSYRGHELVWIAHRAACAIWSSTAIRVTGTGTELFLPSGTVHTADVCAVTSFVADDYVHRGVRLTLIDSSQPILVDEHDPIAETDPTYGWDNFQLSDAHWVSKLGGDFAAWLHVEHRNEAFPHDK
jgi:hypothetical protein